MQERNRNLFGYSRYIKLIFSAWDLWMLNIAYCISFFIRYSALDHLFENENEVMLFIANLSWLFMAYHYKAYKFIRTEYIESILYKAFKMSAILFVTLFTFLVILNYDDVSRLQITYFVITYFVLLFISRILFIRVLKYYRKRGFNYRNVIIIGANHNGIAISNILAKDVAYGYRIKGYFCDNGVSKNEIKILGKIQEALPYLQNNPIHEVYLSVSHVNSSYAQDLIRYCEDNLIRVKLVPDFTNFTRSRKVQIDFYDNIPVVSMRHEPLESTLNRVMKRLFDILFSLLVILLIFPWLFPLLMILVKLSSKGPVFFKQQRSGENNRTFWCLKFRTMRVNNLADELQATKNDSRITSIGKFLRRSNLDELPQFFNVLVGDMSVVGPRPHMLKHTKEYSELINAFLVRHLVKPGITGWAQVCGFRGETINIEQMEKRVEYDIWYIENWSFLLDLKIIFRTVLNMLRGEKNAV